VAQPVQSAEQARVFDLSGGSLSLDFANTVGGSREGRPKEGLNNYGDLVSWAQQAGIVSEERARRLRLAAEKEPNRASAVLALAKELRETIYRLWMARVRGTPPVQADVGTFNRALGKALEHRQLVSGNNRLELGWVEDEALDSILWPVVQSAAELLSSAEAERVRVCEAIYTENCSWLFLDLSRNRSRRWCDMKSCGNRAKARRHYHRKRQN
jgi:predicted RNA-binding Zn ribbon-like protein